ncbi:hypothetical protein F0263_19245 [Vibrio anguillarum]|nr:hypothetical protein [Vibrio anguillarum]
MFAEYFCLLNFSGSKAWFVAERWALFWRLIYHGLGLGRFFAHLTNILIVFLIQLGVTLCLSY